MKKWMLAAAVLALPATSFAGISGAVDAYVYTGPDATNIDPDAGVDDETQGFGVKGYVTFTDALFVAGQYDTGEIGGLDFDESRLGGGLFSAASDTVAVYALAEAVKMETDTLDETGFALHGGFVWDAADKVTLSAQIGHADVGDVGSGPEYTVAAAYEITKPLSVVLERRETFILGGLPQTRFGISFAFGAMD